MLRATALRCLYMFKERCETDSGSALRTFIPSSLKKIGLQCDESYSWAELVKPRRIYLPNVSAG
jgi:hypothetical protein